jgi:hypothetical protein
MARQPAIQVRALFPVTIDAFAHAPVLGRQAMLVLHLAVALLTLYAKANVTLVVEEHVLGDAVDLDPGRRCLGIVVTVLDLYPGMIGNDVIVAVKAFFHCRQPRVVGVVNIRVAEPTLNVFHPRMHVVAEWNRLFGADLGGRRKPEGVNENPDKSRAAKRQQNWCDIAFQDSESFVK